MDLRSKDNRKSTPLHWACYSKSEIALCYLLSWLKEINDQDIEGMTPLHLAVKTVEGMKTTRPVRALLIRGALRDLRNKEGKRAIDLIDNILTPYLRDETKSILKNPKTCSCCMLKTPLKKTRKNYSTTLLFFALILVNYILLLLYILPCKN